MSSTWTRASRPSRRSTGCSRNRFEQLVVDLGEVTFVDSTGMGLVLEVHDRSRSEGFKLRLLRGPDEVQRVFELAGVADVLPFA